MTKTKYLRLIPPGEILAEQSMKPHAVSQNYPARDIDLSRARANDIVREPTASTAAIALRLAKYFGTTPEVWMDVLSWRIQAWR